MTMEYVIPLVLVIVIALGVAFVAYKFWKHSFRNIDNMNVGDSFEDFLKEYNEKNTDK